MTDYAALFKLIVPEIIVVLTSLLVLVVDLGYLRQKPQALRMQAGGFVAALGSAVALFWMILSPADVYFHDGLLVINPLVQIVKGALLILAIFTALVSAQSRFTNHAGEYFTLLLLAVVGMMFMVSSDHILVIFIALELTSLSLYILTAFNKRNIRSAEAALKYFLFGGMSAAVTLYGLSLLYGLSDAATLPGIAAGVVGKTNDPLFLAAMLMTVAGLGFKVAAVPFHLWAPDAYHGAPTPSAALIASGSKVASFYLLARVFMVGFRGAEGSAAWVGFQPGWIPAIALLAILSMLLGNLAAITQSNVKRLLAFSAIAHAGYALLAILADSDRGLSALIYYTITYALTALGAFAVVSAVEDREGEASLAQFAGLSRRAPLTSACMAVFILSLAGIPPLAGFFGKFYVFTAAVGSDPQNLGLLWLVIFAIAMSAVSLYYYLQVLKQIYVVDAPQDAPAVQLSAFSLVAIVLLAAAVLILGCAPDLLTAKLLAALN